MKVFPKLVPLLVFAIALSATIIARRDVSRSHTGAQTAAAKPPVSKKSHREEPAFSQIKAFLRAGDIDGAKGVMRRLGERDPVALFELLENLPGIPGMEEIIRDAAGRLPWNQKEITDLLNRIGPHDWRDLAWTSYTTPRVGILPDEEVFEIGIKARSHVYLSGVQTLLEDAAEKRPDRFLDYLNRLGGTAIREQFFELLAKHHPERMGELFATIPDGSWGCNYDRAYILQARARCLPTAESLMATLKDAGSRGIYSGDFAPLFTYQTYENATAEERGKVLQTIAAQPPLARNRMLAGPLFFGDKPPPPAEFARLTGLYTSGYLQLHAVERWLEKQPDLDPSDRAWIAQLPTERMRTKANVLLDAREKSTKEPH